MEFSHMVGAVICALIAVDAGRTLLRAGSALLRVAWARRSYERTKVCPFCAKRGRAPYGGKSCGICGQRNEAEAARMAQAREEADLEIVTEIRDAVASEITRG